MEITSIEGFLRYYDRIKGRTIRLFDYIPSEKIEWTYKAEKFTIGDLIRHNACIERYMYAETVQGNPSSYTGCGRSYAEGVDEVAAFYKQCYSESRDIFMTLSDEDLQQKCLTPAGSEITVWKWLRAMVEHEIHHRGQLYLYLAMNDVASPPIFGLTSEEVIDRSIK
jgi:uncharacterized damage-inducible protein DinB